jgi:hypothetical protein
MELEPPINKGLYVFSVVLIICSLLLYRHGSGYIVLLHQNELVINAVT